MRHHQLSQLEAISLMVGAGVGAGIMAVPYLTSSVGLIGLAFILPVAWAASAIIHLMLAEVLFRTGKDLQIVELMHLYVLRGKIGKWFLWLIFFILGVAFLANLAAYISGAGEILAGLLSIEPLIAQIIIYGISAGVVFFGLKAVGIAERFGALILVGLVVVLALGTLQLPFHIDLTSTAEPNKVMALYGMVMYALWTFYSVPQVVKGLRPDNRGAVRAILIGLGINGLLTAAVAVIALGISTHVTEVAIIGISEQMGVWAGYAGSIFIMAAMVTSYWSVSLALADIIRERTNIPGIAAWLLATIPSLLILWIGDWKFLSWLRIAAGATAIVVALITIPMYRQSLRESPIKEPGWSLGRLGSPPMLILVLILLVLMAAGSLVSI